MTTKGRQPWIIGALVLALAGCAGAVSPLQSAGTGAARDGSWMSPAISARNLLYVSDEATNVVDVFTFPFGTPAGALQQLHDPVGICTDKTGYVWVVNAPNHVLKYAHGAQRPESTMEDPRAVRLQACSIDPTSGNLAVTDAGRPGLAGNVVIYAGAKGSPKRFHSADLSDVLFCAYDDKGNLFVDGLDGKYAFHLMELPRGGQRLSPIKLDQSVGFPGAVTWDGKYLALGDRSYRGGHAPAIYQIAVSGTHGTVVGTTELRGSCDLLGFTIPKLGSGKGNPQGTRVVAPDVCDNSVRFFRYPAGGFATKRLDEIQYPFSAAVSEAPH